MEDYCSTDNKVRSYSDFENHLRSTKRHKRAFLDFFPRWETTRLETIKGLEELLETLKTAEGITNIGMIAGASVGSSGHDTLNLVGHGLKFIFATAKAVTVSNAREQVRDLLKKDIEETEKFARMGREYDNALQHTKVVQKIRKMSWSHAVDRVEKELGPSVPFLTDCSGSLVSHRDTAQNLIRGLENLDGSRMQGALNALGDFFEENTEVQESVASLLQTGMDAVVLSRNRSDSRGSVADYGCRFVQNASSFRDTRDINECMSRLSSGTSVTQAMIQSTLETLKQELRELKGVYNSLSRSSYSAIRADRFSY